MTVRIKERPRRVEGLPGLTADQAKSAFAKIEKQADWPEGE